LATGEALGDEGGRGSTWASGEMSDDGDDPGGPRTVGMGADTGEEAVGRIFPLAFFSLARLF